MSEEKPMTPEEAVIALGPINRILQAFAPLQRVLEAAKNARQAETQAQQNLIKLNDDIDKARNELTLALEAVGEETDKVRRAANAEIDEYRKAEFEQADRQLAELASEKEALLAERSELRAAISGLLTDKSEAEADLLSLRRVKNELEQGIESLKDRYERTVHSR